MKISKSLRISPVLLALIALSACVGSPPLKVNLPTECDRLAMPEPAPQISGKTDAGEAAAQYAEWGQKNRLRLKEYADCQTRVRDEYARAK